MSTWQAYKDSFCAPEGLGFSLDVSRMGYPATLFDDHAPAIAKAFAAMRELEAGAVANPDEGRQVGHYWLRTPSLAPPERAKEVQDTLALVKQTAADVHTGVLCPQRAEAFRHVLIIGIGGSALGPQLAVDALGTSDDKMTLHFLDNTDPDGIDRVLSRLGRALEVTLSVVISKSGGTKETRNGMVEAAAAYEKQGLSFARHALAITGAGSALDKVATSEGWLRRIPMFDYVGGRTSQLAAVGLLPAALQGVDIDAILSGARDMDAATRVEDPRRNPAMLMAMMWWHATNGRGEKDLVVLPYKDRLVLLSKYLQQLIMESLGKEKDLDGRVVRQGIAVYGNKGSTDQHAYVQQLREGTPNFFATFIEVLRERDGASMEVEPGVTSGDYLAGFLQGTREALAEKGRPTMTITVDEVSPRSLGLLIALFERAVGLYAGLVNINAYHQPGVEAGKKAAGAVLELQLAVVAAMRAQAGQALTADEWAAAIGKPAAAESVWLTLRRLAANGRGVTAEGPPTPAGRRFRAR